MHSFRLGFKSIFLILFILIVNACGGSRPLTNAGSSTFEGGPSGVPAGGGGGGGTSPTPSPTVTAPPDPTVNLQVNNSDFPAPVNPGAIFTLTWVSTGSATCQLYANGVSVGVPVLQGGFPASISENTSFLVTCVSPFGVLKWDTVSVNLIAPSPSPSPSSSPSALPIPVVTLTANSSDGPLTVPYNTSVVLRWATTVVPLSCTISAGAIVVSQLVQELNGLSSGLLTANVTFQASCTFTGGVTVSDQVVVNVPPQPSPVVTHTLFVSSQTYTANLGGSSGADLKCQTLANAVPALTGKTWKAILSTNALDAKDRITIQGDIYNMQSQKVANASGANSLFSGSLLNAVKYNQQGNLTRALEPGVHPEGYEDLWSASSNSGVQSGGTCSDWSSNANIDVEVGNSRSTNGLLDDGTGNGSSCDESKYILCISQ